MYLEQTYIKVLDAKRAGKKINGVIRPGKTVITTPDLYEKVDEPGVYNMAIYIDTDLPKWLFDENPLLWGSRALRSTGISLMILNECDTFEVAAYDKSGIIFKLISPIIGEYCLDKLRANSKGELSPRFKIPKFDLAEVQRAHNNASLALADKLLTGSAINIFLSQPMTGKTEEEITRVKNESIENLQDQLEKALNKFSDAFDFDKLKKTLRSRINVYSNYQESNLIIKSITEAPLKYFGQAIFSMADKDAIVFAKGWENSKGCMLEEYITHFITCFKTIYL